MRRARWLAPWKDSSDRPVIYHCIIRVVDRRTAFGPEEKEQLRIYMRMYEYSTDWMYGVTVAGGSQIDSKALLWKKILPIGSGGGTGTSTYTYNRQGQATSFEDAAGTIHTYGRDLLGREISDTVSNLATGLDDSVLKIVRSYDDHLRLTKVGSYACGAATSPLHEVEFAYDAFGQLAADRQEHDGAVDGSTRAVSYSYESGSTNTIRRTATTYPSGAVTTLGYSAGVANRLSRPDSISLNSVTEAAYRYLGLGRVVGVSYVGISPDPVEMSYGPSHSGLDIFGRVIETLWKKGSDVMQKASYGYDRASNRKWRRDDLAHDLGGAQATRHDNLYAYDGLYQVIGRELGGLVGAPPNYTGITGGVQDESWSYDATGNWKTYGSAAEANLQQTRCHNPANEITHVTNPYGVIQPAYDKVGNQVLDIAPGDWDRGFTLKWDAWNRLIEVKDGETVIQTNAYDGLSRRITSSDGSDITHYYYNDAWRPVEESINAATTPNCRYLWGLRSRWDLVKRERSVSGTLDEKRYALYDAMDPVAICDENGEVIQRFEYSPFGRTTFLSPEFEPDTPGNWTFLFHGEFRDEDTGYYNYGYRFYNDITGRWPSRDPIGENGGVNLYGFVGNDGMNKLDVLGNEPGGEFDGQSNCLGYGLTGRPGYCIWPKENESLRDFVKRRTPDAKCSVVKSSAECKFKKDHARVLIYFYTPKLYKKDPWTDPQGWDSVPGIDVHAMNSGCNKQEWKHVVGRQPNPPNVGDADPQAWDKRNVKIVCCYRPCKKPDNSGACIDDEKNDDYVASNYDY